MSPLMPSIMAIASETREVSIPNTASHLTQPRRPSRHSLQFHAAEVGLPTTGPSPCHWRGQSRHSIDKILFLGI